MAESGIQFVLVHGTFAPNASWMQSDSLLVSGLQKEFGENVSFTQFNWDGLNSFRSRSAAEVKLQEKLLELRRQNARDKIIIIAHSHGGNIATRAASRVSAPSAVSAIITLGTPFIVFDYRTSEFSGTYAFAFILWLCLPIWLLLYFILSADWSALASLIYALTIFVFYPKVLNLFKTLVAQANAKVLEQGLNPSATEVPVLCIRHRGDEAGMWLGNLQLLRRIEKICFRMSAALDRTRLISARYAVAITGLLFTIRVDDLSTLWMNAPILLLLVPPLSVAALFVTSHKRGFGGRPSLIGMCYDLRSQPYPPHANIHPYTLSMFLGLWRSYRSNPAKKIITPHSLGYLDPKAISKMKDWIKYVLRAY